MLFRSKLVPEGIEGQVPYKGPVREIVHQLAGDLLGRRETDDQDPGVGIAEARDGPAPVCLVVEAGDLLAGDSLPPRDEARTTAAGDDLGRQIGQPRAPASGRVVYLSNSLSRRRETIARPIAPMTSRYATWMSIHGPTTPVVRPRSRSTPWYSGVRVTIVRIGSG